MLTSLVYPHTHSSPAQITKKNGIWVVSTPTRTWPPCNRFRTESPDLRGHLSLHDRPRRGTPPRLKEQAPPYSRIVHQRVVSVTVPQEGTPPTAGSYPTWQMSNFFHLSITQNRYARGGIRTHGLLRERILSPSVLAGLTYPRSKDPITIVNCM